jgi:hypothetical protein
VEVRPIQTNREYYLPSKKAPALERGWIVAKKGAKGPILEGNMLPQKMYPFSGPVIGAIAWKLLNRLSMELWGACRGPVGETPIIRCDQCEAVRYCDYWYRQLHHTHRINSSVVWSTRNVWYVKNRLLLKLSVCAFVPIRFVRPV